MLCDKTEGMNVMKTIKIISLVFALLIVFSACGTNTADNTTEIDASDNAVASSSNRTKVKFTMENGGSFVMELYPEYAPDTCENFTKLVTSGFYDGLTFHRVVDGFMAQGGDATGTEKENDAQPIPGEFASNGFSANTLSHERGVVSMARTSDPNSASSQFFICYDDSCKALDGSYAAFGKVIEGMETVDDFCNVERVYNSMGELATPKEPLRIAKAEVII